MSACRDDACAGLRSGAVARGIDVGFQGDDITVDESGGRDGDFVCDGIHRGRSRGGETVRPGVAGLDFAEAFDIAFAFAAALAAAVMPRGDGGGFLPYRDGTVPRSTADGVFISGAFVAADPSSVPTTGAAAAPELAFGACA